MKPLTERHEDFDGFRRRVGWQVYEQRLKASLTQEELANRVRCTQVTISRTESGLAISLYLLWRIAEELNIPIEVLFK